MCIRDRVGGEQVHRAWHQHEPRLEAELLGARGGRFGVARRVPARGGHVSAQREREAARDRRPGDRARPDSADREPRVEPAEARRVFDLERDLSLIHISEPTRPY